MGLFRRRNETYNQQMLREAGLDRVVFNTPNPLPVGPPRPIEPPAGVQEWDTVVSIRDSAIAGDEIAFTTLPNGDVIVEKELGDGDLTPLADAIEEKLAPPYKAAGSRQGVDLWAVGAKRIEVAEIPFPGADALELSQNDGEADFRADREPTEAPAPVELQRLGERVGQNFCVEATRIDGDFWEVKVSPL